MLEWLANDELERMWEEAVLAQLEVGTEGLTKNTKILSQNSLCPDSGLKPNTSQIHARSLRAYLLSQMSRYTITSILQDLVFIVTKTKTQHLIQTGPLHSSRITAVCLSHFNIMLPSYVLLKMASLHLSLLSLSMHLIAA
jgi:hypothetical protein